MRFANNDWIPVCAGMTVIVSADQGVASKPEQLRAPLRFAIFQGAGKGESESNTAASGPEPMLL